MIVTRSWLNEFIDLRDVSKEKLYETFNAIGLEVDSMQEVTIPEKVVVGKILSCEKHPDADKLNVCQIDVGHGVRQIVCGAANVVHAEYVAVATIGAVLPGNFEIKHAKLRGVESEGMVCSSSELGLPEMGNGIMILDESIGELEAGREFGSYEKVADTVIELELTANRGDCLSIYGVARDLSTALDIEMRQFEHKQAEKLKLGIGREAELHTHGEMEADLRYKLVIMNRVSNPFLMDLRLAIAGVEAEGRVDRILAYTTHTTGVVLRTYDVELFRNEEDKIVVKPQAASKGVMEVTSNGKVMGIVGVYQDEASKAVDETKKYLIEASYIDPDTLAEAVAQNGLKTDDLYYKTSRGSNPDLLFGLSYLAYLTEKYTDIECYEGSLDVKVERDNEKIKVDAEVVSSIIGMQIEPGRLSTILQKLGFEINVRGEGIFTAIVPLFRHDIKNIQDIAEEIVRIIGINNIEAQSLAFVEENRLNETSQRYRAKRSVRSRAVSVGFYENVSYVFTERVALEKYGFAAVEEAVDLANPIAEELNTLRSTILVNLLGAVKRNVSYTKKSIPLFEIGSVFGSNREETEVLSLVFSGQQSSESVMNAGKPKMIDFGVFTQKLAAVVGNFELVACSHQNALIHPYHSADIVIDGKVCGFVSKLHPTAQSDFDIPDTFIAELAFDVLLPKHINAHQISKFQGVYKDLSVVIDKSVSYDEVAKVLKGLALPMLKDIYAVDVYEDETLGEKKSLTVRFFIQSMEKTLEEDDIESVMGQVMASLETAYSAQLR